MGCVYISVRGRQYLLTQIFVQACVDFVLPLVEREGLPTLRGEALRQHIYLCIWDAAVHASIRLDYSNYSTSLQRCAKAYDISTIKDTVTIFICIN